MSARVRCEIRGLRRAFGPRCVEFAPGTDLGLKAGFVGPRGLSPAVADLLDVATSVYWIERSLPGRQSTNAPETFSLHIALREPDRWTEDARAALADALHAMGNAVWTITVTQARGAPPPVVERSEEDDVFGPIQRVAMLSGGMDSACGAATLRVEDGVRLVSFYTRQKTVQCRIAQELGHDPPVQFTLQRGRQPGRGRSFHYRGLFFLSIAAAVAESYGARELVQFENGILASAVPPGPAWRMTRHAYPPVHRSLERLFSVLFGDEWKIVNPFFRLTKREAMAAAEREAGADAMDRVLTETDTCWYYWSNRVPGEEKEKRKKRPGTACGVCIPCIVRWTARPGEPTCYDLRSEAVRGMEVLGRAFRSYAGFLSELAGAGDDEGAFYRALPPAGRELLWLNVTTLPELRRLFTTFAEEFFESFEIRRPPRGRSR
jgi:7-cyano-7-deazaguanine synthase in queuosine biosynthesis